MNGSVEAGSVALAGGELSYEARPGFTELMGSVLNERIYLPDGRYVEREDPALWFRSLPLHYHGSYMRAEIID